MTADEASGAKLSPRKQRQMADSFFGPKGVARDVAREHIASTPSASGSAALLSSSPAFATPLHPVRPFVSSIHGAAAKTSTTSATSKPAILPILLPPTTLRPLAFRTFTKKHSLTLTSSALQELATFIGKHCGSGWREEGLAERVLEETAKSWKNRNCGFIVDGGSPELKDILKTLEGNMSGGRIVAGGRGGARAAEAAAAAATSTTTASTALGQKPGLNRQDSLLLDAAHESEFANTRLGLRPALSRAGTGMLSREDSQASSGVGGMDVDDADGLDEDDEGSGLSDPRRWLKVVGAYDQPRMLYNVTKKHFERDTSKPSLLPNTAHKTIVFRNRFNVIHQRLLRNESFQSSAVAEARAVSTLGGSSLRRQPNQPQQTHKITPVANLLGRHGTHHMLLGMLVVLPTGSLSICDLSASIALDLSSAVAIPEDSAWFAPGMIVLVDGVYEEEEEAAGRGLNGATGVGGTIGGRFQAFFIGQPPCEKRKVALGISGPDGGADHAIGGGFGWIDFLGVGSQRAVGTKMRKLEQRLLLRQRQRQRQRLRLLEDDSQGQEETQEQASQDVDAAERPETAPPNPATEAPGRHRVVILGELHLDQPRTLQALKKILALYAAEPEGSTPVAFVLTGNFTEHAVMARSGGSGGSIEYKEYFDALASTLAEYPSLLQQATFVFVPGDNDGWVSAFAGGAAVPLPRKAVPDLFTSRVRRAFASANAELAAGSKGGEAVWTTNPSRLTLFGPNHELVLFRDDISGRLRRTAVRLRGSGGDQMEVDEKEVGGSGAAEDSKGVPEDVEEDSAHNTDKGELSSDIKAARKLVKTILDQGYLAPFRTSLRPVHWDFSGALHLYPLPTALVLVDTTAPAFCVTYEGCHVMNPGSLLVAGRRGAARWVEYELGRTGRVRESTF